MSSSVSDAQAAMLELVSMSETDPELLTHVLPVFYHHLQPDHLSLIKGKNLATEMGLAYLSLKSMSQCITVNRLAPNIVSSIGDHWPSIWLWSQVMIEQGIHMKGEIHVGKEPVNGVNIQTVMSRLFSALTSQEGLCDIMRSFPGVVPALTRFYISLSKKETPESSLPFSCEPLLALITNSSSPLEGSSLQASLQETMKTLNVQSPAVALPFLKTLDTYLSVPLVDVVGLLGSLVTISNVTRDSVEFSDAFIAMRSVSSMARVFSRLTSYKPAFKPHPLDYRIAAACLKVCGTYLRYTLQYGGFGCVVEALEGRLLTSILKAYHFVAYDLEYPNLVTPHTLQTVLIQLLETIGSYSIYRSVVRAVDKSLCRIHDHSTEDHLDINSALRDSWNTFKTEVDLRLDLKGYWEEDDFNLCNNRKAVSDPFLICVVVELNHMAP